MLGYRTEEYLVRFERTDMLAEYLRGLGLLYSYTVAHDTFDTGDSYRLWKIYLPKRGYEILSEAVKKTIKELHMKD